MQQQVLGWPSEIPEQAGWEVGVSPSLRASRNRLDRHLLGIVCPLDPISVQPL